MRVCLFVPDDKQVKAIKSFYIDEHCQLYTDCDSRSASGLSGWLDGSTTQLESDIHGTLIVSQQHNMIYDLPAANNRAANKFPTASWGAEHPFHCLKP